MKKITTIIIAASICFSLTSCSPLLRADESMPTVSEIFTEELMNSFHDNYSYMDPQLKYIEALPYEVSCSLSKDGNDKKGRVGLIADTDKEMFVAFHEVKSVYLLGSYHTVTSYVYQHNDAPIPMKDWTINKITLLRGGTLNTSRGFDDEKPSEATMQQVTQNYVDEYLKGCRVMYESDEVNKEALQCLKKGYAEAISWNHDIRAIRDDGNDYNFESYILKIEFEENSNLVWFTELFELNGKLYFKFELFNADTESFFSHFGLVDDAVADDLIPLLEKGGFDFPVSTEGVFDPYHPTSDGEEIYFTKPVY